MCAHRSGERCQLRPLAPGCCVVAKLARGIHGLAPKGVADDHTGQLLSDLEKANGRGRILDLEAAETMPANDGWVGLQPVDPDR